MEMDPRGAGVEPQGAHERIDGLGEEGVARGRVGQGLGPLFEIGLAEFEVGLGVPGEDGVGPAEGQGPPSGVGAGDRGPRGEDGVPGDGGLEDGEEGQEDEGDGSVLQDGPYLLR